MTQVEAPDWTPSEVVQNLKSLGLGKYGNNFLENDINGEALIFLQDSHMKELGIKLIGHRLTLVHFINSVKRGTYKPSKKTPAYESESASGNASDSDENELMQPARRQPIRRQTPPVSDTDRWSSTEAAPVRKTVSVDQFGRPKQASRFDDGQMSRARQNSRVQYKSEPEEDDDFRDDVNPFESRPKLAASTKVVDEDDDYEPPSRAAARRPTPARRQPEEDKTTFARTKRTTPGRQNQQPIGSRTDSDEDAWPRKRPQAQPQRSPYDDDDDNGGWVKPQPVRRQPAPANRYGGDDPSDDEYGDDEYSPPPPHMRQRPQQGRQQQPSPYADEGDVARAECRYCGRKFAADRIAVHEKVCANSSKRKAKVFDARMQRLQGTDAVKYIGAMDRDEPKPKKDRERYKIEHQKLVETLRSARAYTEYENAKAAGKAVGPPPDMPKYEDEEDDRVACPYCNRKFSADAAKRHIPVCERTNGNKNPRGGAQQRRPLRR